MYSQENYASNSNYFDCYGHYQVVSSMANVQRISVRKSTSTPDLISARHLLNSMNDNALQN